MVLQKKGRGCLIHISNFINEEDGHLVECNSSGNIVRDARTVIYPGSNGDAWWDTKQLLIQMKKPIKIFNAVHPDCQALFIFDQSLAHSSLGDDVLKAFKKGHGHPRQCTSCAHAWPSAEDDNRYRWSQRTQVGSWGVGLWHFGNVCKMFTCLSIQEHKLLHGLPSQPSKWFCKSDLNAWRADHKSWTLMFISPKISLWLKSDWDGVSMHCSSTELLTQLSMLMITCLHCSTGAMLNIGIEKFWRPPLMLKRKQLLRHSITVLWRLSVDSSTGHGEWHPHIGRGSLEKQQHGL